jgi:hypothetical protein
MIFWHARVRCLLCTLLAVCAVRAQVAASDATVEFENQWVRVVRVQYQPHQRTAMHDHPATPTVYVYTTDGGRLRIGHDGEDPVVRPPVKAGAIRFQHAVAERHVVEELDGVASEYLRLELKGQPADQPQSDVRRAPGDRTPYESATLRIIRVTCAPHSACPAPAHPEDPAVTITGHSFHWETPGAPPMMNSTDLPWEQVRVEFPGSTKK